MDIDDIPKPKHQHLLGENLEAISLDELASRITLLRDEILRIEAEVLRKNSSKATADAFFKS
jgi:uncharacterized small protein (DUF1192 family)